MKRLKLCIRRKRATTIDIPTIVFQTGIRNVIIEKEVTEKTIDIRIQGKRRKGVNTEAKARINIGKEEGRMNEREAEIELEKFTEIHTEIPIGILTKNCKETRTEGAEIAVNHTEKGIGLVLLKEAGDIQMTERKRGGIPDPEGEIESMRTRLTEHCKKQVIFN